MCSRLVGDAATSSSTRKSAAQAAPSAISCLACSEYTSSGELGAARARIRSRAIRHTRRRNRTQPCTPVRPSYKESAAGNRRRLPSPPQPRIRSATLSPAALRSGPSPPLFFFPNAAARAPEAQHFRRAASPRASNARPGRSCASHPLCSVPVPRRAPVLSDAPRCAAPGSPNPSHEDGAVGPASDLPVRRRQSRPASPRASHVL